MDLPIHVIGICRDRRDGGTAGANQLGIGSRSPTPKTRPVHGAASKRVLTPHMAVFVGGKCDRAHRTETVKGPRDQEKKISCLASRKDRKSSVGNG
jgi:hypothetical protein